MNIFPVSPLLSPESRHLLSPPTSVSLSPFLVYYVSRPLLRIGPKVTGRTAPRQTRPTSSRSLSHPLDPLSSRLRHQQPPSHRRLPSPIHRPPSCRAGGRIKVLIIIVRSNQIIICCNKPILCIFYYKEDKKKKKNNEAKKTVPYYDFPVHNMCIYMMFLYSEIHQKKFNICKVILFILLKKKKKDPTGTQPFVVSKIISLVFCQAHKPE